MSREEMLVEIATLYLKIPMIVISKYLSQTEANRLCCLYYEAKIREEQCVDS